MPSCIVINCGSTSLRDRNISFYRVPSGFTHRGRKCETLVQRRKLWIASVKRADLTHTKLKYGRVCSKHFITGKPAKANDKENIDWVPRQNMGYTNATKALSASALGRIERGTRRRAQLANISNAETVIAACDEIPGCSYSLKVNENAEKQITVEDMQLALRKSNETIYDLREKISRLEEFTMERFENCDKYTKFYTGLPSYEYLKVVYEAVEDLIPFTPTSPLSKFHQVLLTLIKLRLNPALTDLAYRFRCHHTSASRIFVRTIEILYNELKDLIVWPDREDLQTNMPQCFKQNFGLSTTVIIDCFEVFIEKSSNLDASAKTYSHYKSHHTLKFLIGITPQGSISYISNAYGGRASDKFITEDCGILDNLLPGDHVMADRGFLIKDSVEMYYAEVIMPAFRKGKKQLSAKEIESTRKTANVRIHVERVIGMLRQKFTILHSTLPLVTVKKQLDDQFVLIDKIVVVCCCLINLLPGIIPLE